MTTKELWLDMFDETLSKMPKSERKRVVDFYREMIEDKIEEGKSEEEVIQALGNPYDSAKKILDENQIKYKEKDLKDEDGFKLERTQGKKEMPVWLVLIYGFFGVTVGIPLVVTWFALLVCFWAVFGAMVVSSFACVLAIFASIIMALVGYVKGGGALIGGAIVGAGVTMILAVGFWYLAIYMTKATIWAYKKIANRGEKNE